MDGTLAFGGITTVVAFDASKPPLVSWHACLDNEATFSDALDRWAEADAGNPRATGDQGYFSKHDGADVYTEVDPAGSLEERWERIDDGGGRFLAARRGTSIVVLAGSHFAYAHDERASGGFATYVAGRVRSNGWMVELAAMGDRPEGSPLVLPGSGSQWTVLPGSTVELKASGAAFAEGAP